MTDAPSYDTRLLTPETWADFAALVEANNGVWGGCWCIGFHPEGLAGTAEDHRTPSGRTPTGAPCTRCWCTTAATRSGGASSAP